MVQEILNKGRENAIPSRDLVEILKIDKRSFYAQVERERRGGAPICASKDSEAAGYYLARNRRELEAYCRLLGASERAIHTTRRACLKAGKDLPEE